MSTDRPRSGGSGSQRKLPFFPLQKGAHQAGPGWVNGPTALLNLAHDAALIHHESRAHGKVPVFPQDSVLRAHFPAEITEQRKRQAQVLRKAPVAGNGIHTDAEDLRVSFIEALDISLISLEFLRSASGERQHIKRQHHVLLVLETA